MESKKIELQKEQIKSELIKTLITQGMKATDIKEYLDILRFK
jgi:hypothetical protein